MTPDPESLYLLQHVLLQLLYLDRPVLVLVEGFHHYASEVFPEAPAHPSRIFFLQATTHHDSDLLCSQKPCVIAAQAF